jgi:hypothetical protein
MILRIAGWPGVLFLLLRLLEVQGMRESRRLELRDETREVSSLYVCRLMARCLHTASKAI